MTMPIVLSLEGRVALITGDRVGLVRLRYARLSGPGARHVQLPVRESAVRRLVQACGSENCAAVACDLSGLATARDLVDETVKRFARLDILVANHGIWATPGRAGRPN